MDFIKAKTILSEYRSNNAWFGTHYNMNIYKGCSHGCIYCDSRSECYRVENFDEVRAKKNALSIIEQELKMKRKKGIVATGSMSDPYNPMEKELRFTRGALELIEHYGFGVSIATKSDLILRDIDILKNISLHSPVLIKITITVADDTLCGKIEPDVCVSSKRFDILRELSNHSIFAGILLLPVLPFIADTNENITEMIRLAHEHRARFIYPYFGVTLRQNQRLWYYTKLNEHFPGLRERYISYFGNAYECSSPRAKELYKLFGQECEKRGLLYQMENIIDGYTRGYEPTQYSFLE